MRYVGEILGEDNIMDFIFKDLKKGVPDELSRHTRNHKIEASSRKATFNDWAVKVIKVHTGAIRCLYHVKDIDRGYRMEMDRREHNQALKDK